VRQSYYQLISPLRQSKNLIGQKCRYRRRKKRIEYEIHNVRQQVLIPGRERNFLSSRDKLSLQFFTLYCSELECTLSGVTDKIEGHERL